MMANSLVQLAIKNVLRQRSRSIATLVAIAVGVAGLILAGGFVNDILIQLGEAIIHSQTGHIQIARNGFHEGKLRDPNAYWIAQPRALQDRLSSISPAVAGSTSRLIFSGVLNNGRRDLGVLGEGIEPEAERDSSNYLRFISGRPLNAQDRYGIVIGQGVARSLGLQAGDQVSIVITLSSGALNTLDFEVIGIFQSFSKEFDSRAVRIALKSAQELADTHSAHLVVVNLAQTAQTGMVATLLKEALNKDGYEITTWNALSDFYEKTVQLYDRQFGVLRLITLLMVLLSVANSVNMTLFERTREFGTMRALGNRSNTIFRLIVIENFWLGAIGSIFGCALGVALALSISAIGIAMPPPPNANLGYIAQIRLDLISVTTAGFIGLTACLLASLLPAYRASRLDIGEALRSGV